MMTLRRFARISGHDAVTENSHGWKAAAMCTCGEKDEVIYAYGASQEKALRDLLNAVYKHHSFIVFQRQNWKCLNCRGIRPLQAHHRIPRSKGRSDRVPNLMGLCPECHERETNPK